MKKRLSKKEAQALLFPEGKAAETVRNQALRSERDRWVELTEFRAEFNAFKQDLSLQVARLEKRIAALERTVKEWNGKPQ